MERKKEEEKKILREEERRGEGISRTKNWLNLSINTGIIGTSFGFGLAIVMGMFSNIGIFGLIGFLVGFTIPIFIYLVDFCPYYEWSALKDELKDLERLIEECYYFEKSAL